ncbi:DEAD/DEAH box helicase [Roseivivax halodurans JCM 10272]|uniref:DEAD/DEAH box helicase n=1 Tax=Roseivivax halodurans JCM 10272 TaxID=1449350 RepID=X7EIY0_9RHOB|nr:DEAD/DEAH box helicase [Roseivivax halodurans]ETX15126.1 DEAD/DEAH box helicase [Roseivivax halodurans JCM 10272]
MIKTLSDALSKRGYDTLTPVQEAVIDPDLVEADLLVSAQTGSGKTVGFGLAIGPTLLDDEETFGEAGAPLALIVAPTRELAFQVMRELSWLYEGANARVASCVGGMDMRDERRALERGAHIVVGTPGRLRDHIQRGSLDLSSIRAVVLDEADEMLDLGFREDLEYMLGEAPEDKRTLMFSATVPPMIAKLAEQYQHDAVRVNTVSERSQHADISYQALQVAQHDTENAIINLLRFHEAQNAIVFANTRATVNRLAARFGNRGFAVVTLSGELSQSERSNALQSMRDGRARVCIATDVAARGIDLPNLELVIHAELPSNGETLLHRSGRTGRAGRKGISAMVVPPKVAKKAERLLQSARITAEWMAPPSADEVRARDEERLLTDPVWAEEITEDEASFAGRLLAEHGPEAIVAAYLRLYRTKHSAPEELSDPAAAPVRKERAPFGPSVWFSLSVGRDDRAEPRWLLPILLRTGGLEKDAIGAIRVQKSETFVEVAEASAPALVSALGADGVLEEGLTAKRLDGVPDMGPSRPEGGRPPAKHRKGDGPRTGGPDRGEDKPRAKRWDDDKPKSKRWDDEKPRGRHEDGDAPRAKRWDDDKPRARREDGDAPRKKRWEDDKPRDRSRDEGKPRGKPWESDRPQGKREGFGKPGPRKDGGAAREGGPARKSPGDAPRKPGKDGAPQKRGGFGKPEGKFGKPEGKFGKPAGEGKFGKPAGKPKPRADASDTSKRFSPPKGAKAAPRKGGDQPPKRGRT